MSKRCVISRHGSSSVATGRDSPLSDVSVVK